MVKVEFVKLRLVLTSLPCFPPCLLQYNAIHNNKSMARGCRLSKMDLELWITWYHGCLIYSKHCFEAFFKFVFMKAYKKHI